MHRCGELQLWLTRAWVKAAGTVWVQSETTSLFVARELAAQRLEEASLDQTVERAVAMADATTRLAWLQAAQETD